MSWLERCYQTYEYIRRAEPDLIGRQEPNRATLLPVGHTTQQAQIQVELDLDGNFLNAFVLRKDEQTTIIPCRERRATNTFLTLSVSAYALPPLPKGEVFAGTETFAPKLSLWESWRATRD